MKGRMLMSRRSTRLCAYCGKPGADTTDHVIPKLLFQKPYPPDLITVRAHRVCNEDKKRDDELLRDYIVSDIAGSTHPEAAKILQGRVMRAVRRRQSEWAKIASETASVQQIYTKHGIYLGDAAVGQLPDGRMERVISRIARGLYFHHTRIVIPQDYDVTLYRIMPWEVEQAFDGFKDFNVALCGPLGDVFVGGCVRAAEDPLTTAWFFSFYERVHFALFLASPSLRNGMR